MKRLPINDTVQVTANLLTVSSKVNLQCEGAGRRAGSVAASTSRLARAVVFLLNSFAVFSSVKYRTSRLHTFSPGPATRTSAQRSLAASDAVSHE